MRATLVAAAPRTWRPVCVRGLTAQKSVRAISHDFDGVALEWYVDLPFLLSAIDWVSEPGSAAAAAEQSLIDFSSARAMLAVNRTA